MVISRPDPWLFRDQTLSLGHKIPNYLWDFFDIFLERLAEIWKYEGIFVTLPIKMTIKEWMFIWTKDFIYY